MEMIQKELLVQQLYLIMSQFAKQLLKDMKDIVIGKKRIF